MKAKKLIATGIATSMLLLALTGCGAGGNSGKIRKRLQIKDQYIF